MWVDGYGKDWNAQDAQRVEVRARCVAGATEKDDRTHFVGVGDERSLGTDRLQARSGLRRHGIVVAGKQQRAQLGDESWIAAEQEAKRLAHAYVHRARIDAFANEGENVARVGSAATYKPSLSRSTARVPSALRSSLTGSSV